MVYLLNPDDLDKLTFGVAFALYWPMVLGALVLFVLLVNGFHKMTIPAVGMFMLLQAWHSGVFG